MSLNYVTITETFDDGSGTPLAGYVTFTPSESVYASGIPLVSADNPVTVDITAGALASVHLLATDNPGLSYEGLTGFFYWTAQVVIGGITQEPWSFFLPSSPTTVDLYSLANTGAGGGGGGVVDSVTAADASIVVGGTTANPTVRTGTLDVIATQHPPAASVPMNSHKLTGLANGSAATDSVAYGQLGTAAFQATSAFDAAGTSAAETTRAEAAEALLAPLASPALTGSPTAPTQTTGDSSTKIATDAFVATAVATETTRAEAAEALALPKAGGTMTGWLAPAVVALTDAATIAVNAALGNDFRVTLGGNRTMGAPSNPVDGQDITFLITQPGSGGPYTVTWASGSAGYDFGTAGAPTLSTAANKRDMVAFKYCAAATAWLCMGSALGF